MLVFPRIAPRQFAPLYHARQLNESRHFTPPLPPLGENGIIAISQPAQYYQTDWIQQFLRFSSGGSSRLEFGAFLTTVWRLSRIH